MNKDGTTKLPNLYRKRRKGSKMKALFNNGRFVGTCSDEEAAVAIEKGTADSMLTADPNEVAQLSVRPPTLGQRLQGQINSVARTLDECATDLVERAPSLCGAAKDKVISCAKKIKKQGEKSLAELRILAHEATAPVEPEEAPEEAPEAPEEAPIEAVEGEPVPVPAVCEGQAPAESAPEAPVAEVVEEEIPE